MLSPCDSRPYPVAAAEGDSLAVTGLVRNGVLTSTTNHVLCCIGNTGLSATPYAAVTYPAAGGAGVPVPFVGSIATLSLSASAGGPTSGRPMKCGVDIANSTAPLNATGFVYVLNAKQRLLFPASSSLMTETQWAAVAGGIIAHADTKCYTAADFIDPKHFYTHPVDHAAYLDYNTWLGVETATEVFRHSATWSGATALDRPMSFIWVLFDTASAANNFILSVRASYYTRWPLSTVPALLQQPVPVAPLSMLNASQALAERQGSAAIASSKTDAVDKVVASGRTNVLNVARKYGSVVDYGGIM